MFLGKKVLQKPNVERQSMSVEKVDKTLKNSRQQDGMTAIKHWGTTQRIHTLVMAPISSDPGDKKKLYKFPVASGSGIRRKTLVIRQLQYIISRWTGDSFPNVIYLTCNGFNGYLKKQGEAFATTPRIAALQIQQVSPVLDDAALRTYDLRYALKQSVSWIIPGTVTDAVFGLRIDQQTQDVDLPLPNPMSLNFQLRYQTIGPQN